MTVVRIAFCALEWPNKQDRADIYKRVIPDLHAIEIWPVGRPLAMDRTNDPCLLAPNVVSEIEISSWASRSVGQQDGQSRAHCLSGSSTRDRTSSPIIPLVSAQLTGHSVAGLIRAISRVTLYARLIRHRVRPRLAA